MIYVLRPSIHRSISISRIDGKKQVDLDRDNKNLNRMLHLVGFGLMNFLSGFAAWYLDNTYCDHLRRWRRGLGLPWGLLLEGHGWW